MLNMLKKILMSIMLIIIVIMIGIMFISFYRKIEEKDVKYAKQTMQDIKKIRMAIDEYYIRTEQFPNLVSQNEEKLSTIKAKEKNSDNIVYFSNILGEEHLPFTAKYKDLEKSNTVYEVENFSEISNIGGWNYNKQTGEIRVNLPKNFFNQGIDWNTF